MLSAKKLLSLLVSSLSQAGCGVSVYDASKPFGIRISRPSGEISDLRVYIWNCTHGGGRARPENEYRIQFTGVVPAQHQDATTLLLGWHEIGVFAAWDIRKHENQDSSSPSAQIREDVLQNAYRNGFAVGARGNGEVVAAFRPELIAEYAENVEGIHDGNVAELEALNNLPNIGVREAEQAYGRKKIVSEIVRAYRAHDFSKRVLSAYSNVCAVCGLQLRLVEAAHIVPVTSDASTDSTENGIALCVLHHRAYDKNIISIDEGYRIQVSETVLRGLGEYNLLGGLEHFRGNLREMMLLPADRRDYPSPGNLALSRRVRAWQV
ncbi:HNH endonuclease [Xanthomonas translucens]|uniref:HNH endonuclease n=1 Tax=Xanthomonas campestris pv. translucens TaxID=343 RepID=UPI0009B7B482|nr:HNH endonuclease [Xanthomonas translucens]MBC3972621.1 HNH endonuclease [Xanthomonas translucens pv. undulosa]QSQ55878.1 HNH endonuclease [Xanthomonas translucens pv. undulosa]UKE39461.1 HNH endonuclease [Xanthomonas translucens pv. undulosa]UKE45464.1 HNH endonuclease [Xanthomonas translucens pv. secalis]